MSHFTVGVILPTSIDLTPKPPAPPPVLEVKEDANGDLVAVEPSLAADPVTTAVTSVETLEQVVDNYIESVMERYSESREVPEYDHECWCIGGTARSEVNAAIVAEFGDIDIVRTTFHAREDVVALKKKTKVLWRKDGDPEPTDAEIAEATAAEAETDRLWQELTKPRRDKHDALLEAHPLKDASNAECDECNGTGTYKSTYNPESQWDWYRIGGRWDGDLIDNQQRSENGFNFDRRHETLTNNAIKIADLLTRAGDDDKALYSFFAMLTPDGEWIEKGDMGWWGMVADEKDEGVWKAQVRTVYEKFREHWVVLLDAHI